ncbi:hypothetical protein ACFHWV_23030 [Micromonospora sp. LOL_028]|uniref:hypothetical protein n=1 Tax=Micromonospora sp. LOL_028 TaxID=3345420 RepID=UPI003A87D664
MLTRRPPRLTAVLLVGAVVVLSACGPAAEPGDDGDGDGTTATQAPDAATSPGALPVRDDLIAPQVVAWRTWRAVDDRTLEFTVTAGPVDCYGAEPQVQESETAVRVQIRVGRLPEAADQECPAIALESAVLVRLAAPLGDREVEQLD